MKDKWLLATSMQRYDFETVRIFQGGIKGVVFTDVFQAFIMLAGLLIVTIMVKTRLISGGKASIRQSLVRLKRTLGVLARTPTRVCSCLTQRSSCLNDP